VKEIVVKSVLSKKKRRDSWFLDEYTLNPYEGCSMNCQYCYLRGSKYGKNMEDTLSVKKNGLEILDRQLSYRKRKQQYGLIALASATDPYLKAEATWKMTQGFLRLILKHHFPVLIITRSPPVLRDVELLKAIDRSAILPADLSGRLNHGAIVSFSFSTLDDKITRTLEPGAPSPAERLEAMRACKAAGLMTGMNCVPVLPFLSDSDEQLEEMILSAKSVNADYILIGGLTLFGDQPADSKTLYYKFLDRSYPDMHPSYKKLYGIFSMPSMDHIRDLDSRAEVLCVKHGVRRGILPLQ
jgi:DNA repair photolyase